MPMPPICPVDRSVMLQGADGVWRCRRQHRHEFRVIGRGDATPGQVTDHCNSNMACPLCGAEMTPIGPATWACTANPNHELHIHPRAVCLPPRELIRKSPLLDRAGGGLALQHWLSHIGITGVLLPPPQGNTRDGTYCQPLGDIAPGGGSKSGRRKRKKPKRTDRPLEPWGA